MVLPKGGHSQSPKAPSSKVQKVDEVTDAGDTNGTQFLNHSYPIHPTVMYVYR